MAVPEGSAATPVFSRTEVCTESQGHHVGNFHNYYAFHACAERLHMLDGAELLRAVGCTPMELRLLDVGCNEGDLTLQLRDWLSALFPASLVVSLGVDVDGELIARAAKKRDGCQRTAFAAADVMQPDFCRVVREWEAGHDARRDASDRADAAAASSPACQVPPAARTVRIVSLFSVTMWVHLNHGDEGLAHLLQTVSRWADVLILEPQPWKCYSTAARRLRRMGLAPHERLASLRWREAQLPAAVHRTLTQECGMDGFSDMGVSEAWKRAVLLYWHEPRRWEMAAGEVPASEGDSACPAARQTGLDTAGDTACKVHTRGREDAAAAGSEPEADTIAARTKRRRT